MRTAALLVFTLLAPAAALLLPNSPRTDASARTSAARVTTRRAALLGALSISVAKPAASHATPPSGSRKQFERAVIEAYTAFTKGEYMESERLWLQATQDYPEEALAWQNLATVLIINASEQMTLGQLPTGEALQRLQRALTAFNNAENLGETDALLVNARGNALGLLQRWEEAHAAYAASVDLSPRDLESIPLSNQALTSFELGRADDAEKEALRLTRRDPNFRDGFALLATLRHSRGDEAGAASAFRTLCSEEQWCERYSTDAVVLGRWTPRAVSAFRSLLRAPAIQDVRAAKALS